MGNRPDLPGRQPGEAQADSALFSAEELAQLPLPQQLALRNMLGERLRRRPPPTAAELQGIKQLATQVGSLAGRH